MYNIKFIFHLKSGKVFECVEELNDRMFLQVVDTVKTTFREGVNGSLQFGDCCIRLSECSVVEWEVLNES